MNYYESNKESIKTYKPSLYQALYKVAPKSHQDKMEEIENLDARDGTPILKVIRQGKEYRLNSLYRPGEEARRWVEQYNFYNHQTIISMFGLGNGIFANTILKKMKEEDTLLIYEPSINIFSYVLEHYDLSSIIQNAKVHIYIKGVNEDKFTISLKNKLNIANYRNLLYCYHPQYDLMYLKEYEEYLKAVMESQQHMRANINTGIYFSQRYIENSLKNLKFLHDSISLQDLKEHIPTHVPALVIAAGPSVEKNIENLKQAKGKAVLFAVDRILDYLLDSGVVPDFVVSIDPKKDIKYFTERIDVKVPLICYGESNYEILKQHCGMKVMGVNKKFTGEIYRRAGKMVPNLHPAGSVAIVAYNACVVLGFTKIILVGQDLAYDGDRSHGGNSVEDNQFKRDILVEGIDGEMVKSRSDWKIFIETYKDLIALSPSVEVIDAKLKGGKIPGTINMELKDAIEKYCTEEIGLDRENIEKIVGFTDEEWKSVYEYITQSPKELVEIKKNADRGIAICKELLSLYGKKNIDSYKIDKGMKKLKNINTLLSENPIYNLLDMNVIAIVTEELSEVYRFSGNKKENEKTVIEKSQRVYEATIKSIEYVSPLIEEAINVLESNENQ